MLHRPGPPKRRFSLRALKFLKLYFVEGMQLMDAARSAGYKGATPQSLCNTGLAILRRYTGDSRATVRRRIGAQGVDVGQLLTEVAENGKSEHQQFQTLMLLSKCISRR